LWLTFLPPKNKQLTKHAVPSAMVGVMNNDFPYLEIPKTLEPAIGPRQEGKRVYRREWSDEEVGPWYDAICDAFRDDKFVSPGGSACMRRSREPGFTSALKTVS